MAEFEKGREGGSQSNEDEIVAKLFRAMGGEGRKRFIEFGCGDGRQNNTIALLKRGWSGVWIDKRRRVLKSAESRWSGYPVKFIRRMMSPTAAQKLINELGPFDFLSIDVDGGDFAIWQSITSRPRLVCIEYAPQPPGKTTAPPVPLGEFVDLATSKGYFFAGVSESKVNAFFIAREPI